MELIIHKGSGQIGGNVVEINTNNARVILDCGKNLPPLDWESKDNCDGDRPSHQTKNDNFALKGLTYDKSVYDAVFVTHYHADHYGLTNRVNTDIPIYASRETKDVLTVISDFIDSPEFKVDFILNPYEEVRIKDLTITPFPVRHSAKGALMFLVESDNKKILYTGDFNGFDKKIYERLGNVDVLLTEGTNIGFTGSLTENDIENESLKIMQETNGHVFVLASSSNIDRIVSINNACQKCGRKLAIDPFLKGILEKITDIKLSSDTSIGFMPRGICKKDEPRAHKYLASDYSFFNGLKRIYHIDKLVYMVRQSMGRFLIKLNEETPLKGASLIYSMWKGYNKSYPTKGFLKICKNLGISEHYLHTSGHAYVDVLKDVIETINPKVIIPIHTESPDKFKELYDNTHVLGNGEVYRLD
jgi:ribonuclease J